MHIYNIKSRIKPLLNELKRSKAKINPLKFHNKKASMSREGAGNNNKWAHGLIVDSLTPLDPTCR